MIVRKALSVTALALLLTVGAAQAQSDLWLHVTVEESTENANIKVNLPLSLVESALAMIPDQEIQSGKIVFDDAEFSAADLRNLWNSIQTSPDMTFITVEGDNENVRVRKEAGYIKINVIEDGDSGAKVDVKVPMAVVEALLEDTAENELNVAAALRALADHGEGELATVTDDNAYVRVWIDDQPEAN